jgi:hypothetical protein
MNIWFGEIAGEIDLSPLHKLGSYKSADAPENTHNELRMFLRRSGDRHGI